MGTIYILEKEYGIGADFFNEAMAFLKQTDPDDEELCVSTSSHLIVT